MMKTFSSKLRKLKINNIKNPMKFAGNNAVILEIQTAMKNWFLSSQKYSGFLDFGRKNCGAKFIRAMANGQVEFNLFDTYNEKMKGKVNFRGVNFCLNL